MAGRGRSSDYWRAQSTSGYGAYVPVADKQAIAKAEIAKRRARGEQLSPAVVAGRNIANTFWGKAWCRHCEQHCDYGNRLPRGRTYARNGSVIDVKITTGEIQALVVGKNTYKVTIAIEPLAEPRWAALCKQTAGRIDSLVGLLQGKLDKATLERLCHRTDGMFPSGAQMKLSCSCPDWAKMCKHVAATLYGVGARLDEEPALLFVLRGVDQDDLLDHAALAPLTDAAADTELAGDDLGALFGVEIDDVFEVSAESLSPPGDHAAAGPAALDPTPAAASVPAPAAPPRAPKPRKNGKTATNFALEALARHAGEEMLVEGLWQLSDGKHSRAALRQGLNRLHDKGLVRRDKDEDGSVWWQINGAPAPL